MIRKTFLFLVLMVFFSCQNVQRPEKPDNLIDKSKMRDILYDVSIINATRDLGRYQLENAGIAPEKFIYKKYGIDSLQFAKSMEYYSVDFSTYLAIWKDVNERLDRERDVVDSLKRKRDSIKAAENRKMKPNTAEDDLPAPLNRPDDMDENQG